MFSPSEPPALSPLPGSPLPTSLSYCLTTQQTVLVSPTSPYLHPLPRHHRSPSNVALAPPLPPHGPFDHPAARLNLLKPSSDRSTALRSVKPSKGFPLASEQNTRPCLADPCLSFCPPVLPPHLTSLLQPHWPSWFHDQAGLTAAVGPSPSPPCGRSSGLPHFGRASDQMSSEALPVLPALPVTPSPLRFSVLQGTRPLT